MNAQPTRRIVVLLPPLDASDDPTPLLHAAAALASTGRLDVLALRRADQPEVDAAPLPALAAETHWWDLSHPGLARIDAAQLLPLWDEALHQADIHGPMLALLPASPLSEECAAHLAHKRQGTTLGRCTDLSLADDGSVQARRAAYGGRVELTLHSTDDCCLATWRPASTPTSTSTQVPVRHTVALQTALPEAPQATQLASADRMPALEGAPLVVCGGRGMQGEAGFAMLARIAEQLGGSLGGSLPTVDAGWVPVARQIGQSGKFVRPRTYFSVGVSGTPQHMAGISRESRIIAVNSDASAPIFKRADVGVVAEWQALLPHLIEQLEHAR